MSLVIALLGLLPASRQKNRLLSWCGRGWSVAPTARIHPILLWRVGLLRLGEGAGIGPGTVLRDVVRVDLGDEASLGQLNWVTAEARYAEQRDADLMGSLVLERGAAIASRHYLDCAGGLHLGPMSILAGVRTTVLTHWADHMNWVLRAAPVRVGASTIVSSGVTLTAGAEVPDGSIVGAGAVVPKPLGEPAKLYVGVPAKPVADVSGSAHLTRATPKFARVASH